MALYERPATRFVAGFLGSPSMNFLSARFVPDGTGWAAEFNGARRIALPAAAGFDPAHATTLGVRPEHWRIVDEGGLPARVEMVELLGGSGVAHLRLEDGSGNDIVTFKTHDGTGAELTSGARVQLRPDFARALWFDAKGSTLAGANT
jgi:ABC-type sugar transport system ATPase subunit